MLNIMIGELKFFSGRRLITLKYYWLLLSTIPLIKQNKYGTCYGTLSKNIRYIRVLRGMAKH